MTHREAALRIVRTLHEAGYLALFAGGCVRDMLMRRRPEDYDVATDARPDQIMELFRRTQKVGVQFGVVIVGLGRQWVEVATFRSDLGYLDGRRPTAVRFTSPEEDAKRRDFTINGMFYHPLKRRIIDYVSGRADIRRGVIRAIGEPAARFAEDHLRMLRAVRFAARFDYRIEPQTHEAIRRHAEHIGRVSAERICDELCRILEHSSRARGWRLAAETGLLRHLWPGAERLATPVKEGAARLAALPKRASFELALAAVLRPLGGPEVRAACAALRTSNETREAVGWLLHSLGRLEDVDQLTRADVKLLMARGRFEELLALFAADLKACGQSTAAHRRLSRWAASIPHEAVSPPRLLNGHDLTRMRVPAGPIYRRILDRVYYAQLNGEITTHTEAREAARRFLIEAQVGFDDRRGET